MQNLRQRAWLLPMLMLATAISLSAQAPRLELKTTVTKEVKAGKAGAAKATQVPVDKTAPGDVLTYTVSYQNVGKTAANEASIVDPVPAGTVYRLASARGEDAEVTCSIDGGQSWHAEPVLMLTKKPSGEEAMVPAPADRYTHVRWVLRKPLAPGATGKVVFTVTVQ